MKILVIKVLSTIIQLVLTQEKMYSTHDKPHLCLALDIYLSPKKCTNYTAAC